MAAQEKEADVKASRGCVGCLVWAVGGLVWLITSFLLGLSMKEGLDDDSNKTHLGAGEKDQGSLEVTTAAKRWSCSNTLVCLCRCLYHAARAVVMTIGKALACLWRFIRLLIIFFGLALGLSQFMLIIIKTSKTTDLQAKNMTCSSVPTYYDTLSPSQQRNIEQSGGMPDFQCGSYDYPGKEALYKEACILRTQCGLQGLSTTYDR